MQEDEASISLHDLQNLPESPANGLFAAYLSDARKGEKPAQAELRTLDTKDMPKLPLRRHACAKCINEAITCEKCPQCHYKGQTCCRGLACLYDYDAYKEAPDNHLYKSCRCTFGQMQPSGSVFGIDWRLAALMQRLPKDPDCRYILHLAGGVLWATRDPPDDQGGIYYEDNFGTFAFHERQIREPNPASLFDSNSRQLTGLINKNIKQYLSTKDGWEVSNLEEECQDIVDQFFANKKLEAVKAALQSPQADNPYSNNPSLKFQGKYTQELTSKAQEKQEYRDCSDLENEELLFSYSSKTQLIYLRNARYFEKEKPSSNLRPVRVHWKSAPATSQAIWFKDRKGDIFAFSKDTLSIFKFHLPSKSFVEFVLETNTVFNSVDSAACLLYVPQRDTVYYFNQKDLKSSFFFALYRPKGQEEGKEALSKRSCTSIKPPVNFLADKEKVLPRTATPCRAVYAMEDHKFKIGKETRKELVPVIYLLCERKGYIPVGIGLCRIVHTREITEENFITFTELPALAPTAPKSNEKKLAFTIGVHFVWRVEKGVRLQLFSLMDGKPTLLSARVVSSEGKEAVEWTEEFLELTGRGEVKQVEERAESYMVCSAEAFYPGDYRQTKSTPILLTDLVGAPANNELRLLGENNKTGRVVQVSISTAEGTPKWRIFDF